MPLSRHSSLNELRSLVDLFKPRDLFPCVEDPDKLTYLDLEGCFGDLCDLTNCTYLKNVRPKSNVTPEEALEKMLAERWAYDDISEDESDEDDETNSVVELDCVVIGAYGAQTESALEHTTSNRSFEARKPISTLVNSAQRFTDRSSTDDDSDDDRDRLSGSSSPAENLGQPYDVGGEDSFTVLFRDEYTANEEMVQHFYDIARKGGNISLKSVVGDHKESLL